MSSLRVDRRISRSSVFHHNLTVGKPSWIVLTIGKPAPVWWWDRSVSGLNANQPAC